MPASIVRCDNRDCPHAGTERRVEMAEAGPGLYHRPALVCECGHFPHITTDHRPQSAAPAPPEKAVRNQPERRGKRR